jgi:hypothetical protein
MLRILGSAKTLCNQMTRRDMLRVGGLGALSAGTLAFPSFVQAGNSAPNFGKAKRVIVLFLYGAAAQHELWDLKPDAPDEIRGTFKPIATNVPGIEVCEHLPSLARVADRCCFIRSMTHPYNIHSAAYTLTGIDKVDVVMEVFGNDPRHWPFFGSALTYVDELRQRTAAAAGSPSGERHPPSGAFVPPNVALPFRFSSRVPGLMRGGPYGGFLGPSHQPLWTEFDGKATRTIERWLGNKDQKVADPYAGIEPDCKFTFSEATRLRPEITLDRLNRRRDLLQQFEDGRRALDSSASTTAFDQNQEYAYSLIASPKIQRALDVSQESAELRERYGMTLFGQATLVGRRFLEAGSRVVTVFWDEYQTVNSSWDTHFRHFERLKDELLPGLDKALSALLLDLEERGMLDDTLVMVLTEHGRTPKLSTTPRGAGREHWSGVYSTLLAGAGIARGTVVGKSDKQGAFVSEDPVSPKDVLCTMYHLLGIDPHSSIPDQFGRPVRLVGDGDIHPRLLS